jgi:hypothetical protein
MGWILITSQVIVQALHFPSHSSTRRDPAHTTLLTPIHCANHIPLCRLGGMDPISIHSLPAEIINLIVDFIGIREETDNRRLLPSEHKLCVCSDAAQERYYHMKTKQQDLRFHSDTLKLSSLSRQLRMIIFDSRKIKGLSVPFYRSALNRLMDMPEDRRNDVV